MIEAVGRTPASRTIRACAKTILAGEHSVIRGEPALVVPVFSCELNVTMTKSSSCRIFFQDQIPLSAQTFFENVLERALQQVGRAREELNFDLTFRSTIPIGGGMGSSAALCVSVARVFESLGWLSKDQLFEFARGLEDLFHGTSSGVDVAACLENAAIRFRKNLRQDGVMIGVDWKALTVNWEPLFFISFSGSQGVTSECVQHVRGMWESDRQKAKKIDLLMTSAVEKIQTALGLSASEDAQALLVDGVNTGRECFEQWGLIQESLQSHMTELNTAGASAVKPTGSGGGGYVLSLWTPQNLMNVTSAIRSNLIPIAMHAPK